MTKKFLDEKIIGLQKHPSDTGSAQVQIMILTQRINELNKHIDLNPKDHSTKRGLMKLVGKRHRLSKYLRKHNPEGYEKVKEVAGLRK
jgi:small subunit ribosomal protein S15